MLLWVFDLDSVMGNVSVVCCEHVTLAVVELLWIVHRCGCHMYVRCDGSLNQRVNREKHGSNHVSLCGTLSVSLATEYLQTRINCSVAYHFQEKSRRHSTGLVHTINELVRFWQDVGREQL